MRCRESPLLLSEVDAAVSGETSLDHEAAARVVVTVRMTGTSTETYPADPDGRDVLATASRIGTRPSVPSDAPELKSAKWRQESLTSGRFADGPVAEIVQCGEPIFYALLINNLQDQPNRSIELPQRKSLIKSLATTVSNAPRRVLSIDQHLCTTVS